MRDVKEIVRQTYGEAAERARRGRRATCGCGTSACCGPDPMTSNLYEDDDTVDLPAGAVLASLGCGNPTALADLQPGEVVLDLGSGGGIDVLLAARRVGPTGKAYGLDMTDEMLALARQNQAASGLTNVEFLRGEIERIPLPDDSVDVVISNCVINLAADKDQVFAEAFRVLRPGGRIAVSDVVVRGTGIPAFARGNMELWLGCVAGALEESDYQKRLMAAGFERVALEATRVYTSEEMRQFIDETGLPAAGTERFTGRFVSAFVRASKPASRAACCGPTCCEGRPVR